VPQARRLAVHRALPVVEVVLVVVPVEAVVAVSEGQLLLLDL
jgi:hypothetical protein